MSQLLDENMLTLFETGEPQREEVIEVFEFYAEDKLFELGVDVDGIKTLEVTPLVGDPVTSVTFDIKGTTYQVVVKEWATSHQGYAVPLVELIRT